MVSGANILDEKISINRKEINQILKSSSFLSEYNKLLEDFGNPVFDEILRLSRTYGITKPPDATIYLVPIPSSSQKIISRYFDNRIYVPYLLEQPRKVEYFLVSALHEYAHILFDTHEFREILSQSTTNRPSAFKHYLNEALATYFTSSVAAKNLFGTAMPQPWYDDRIINRISLEINPSIYGDISNHATTKRLIESLQRKWDKKYYKRFEKLTGVFSKVSVYCDRKEYNYKELIYRKLRTKYEIQQYKYYPEIEKLEHKHISQKKYTKLFLLQNSNQLKKIELLYGLELPTQVSDNESFVYAFFDAESESNVVIQIGQHKPLLEVLARVSFGNKLRYDRLIPI
jgi:hypothetical protein